ncbi:putative major facilitator superfamily domain, MFS transporter superfamily [Helianthus anomalus]
MIGRALTSVLWGVVADRYGRKPVILLGTSSVFVTISTAIIMPLCFIKFLTSVVLLNLVILIFFRVIFNTLFGFSVNYWMTIITRFLLGFLNGLLG